MLKVGLGEQSIFGAAILTYAAVKQSVNALTPEFRQAIDEMVIASTNPKCAGHAQMALFEAIVPLMRPAKVRNNGDPDEANQHLHDFSRRYLAAKLMEATAGYGTDRFVDQMQELRLMTLINCAEPPTVAQLQGISKLFRRPVVSFWPGLVEIDWPAIARRKQSDSETEGATVQDGTNEPGSGGATD